MLFGAEPRVNLFSYALHGGSDAEVFGAGLRAPLTRSRGHRRTAGLRGYIHHPGEETMPTNSSTETVVATPSRGRAALRLPGDGRPCSWIWPALRTGRSRKGWACAVIIAALLGAATPARARASQRSDATPAATVQGAGGGSFLPGAAAGSAPDTIPRRSSLPTREMRGFRFRLLGCERSSASVRCTLQVTSLRGDRPLRLCAQYDCGGDAVSVAFSGSGIDHRAKHGVLGSRNNYAQVRNELIEGEPMNAAVDFHDVPTRASTLTRLRVAFDDGDGGFYVPFTQVNIR